MGFFNWLRDSLTGPSPCNKCVPLESDLAAQAGLSPQGWAKAFNEARPQPHGGRLLVNGIEQPRPIDRARNVDRGEDFADKLVICGNKANHESLLDLEANFRAWYKNKYGQPYFGAIPITVAIEWGQHLSQRRQDPPAPEPGEVPSDRLMQQWQEECVQLSADSEFAIPPSNFMAQRVAAWARQQHAHLPARILAICKKRGWSLKWADRGCYLHLESSELIESLRGKRGEPAAEAGDVLFVLMSITEHAGISWADVLKQASAVCARLEGKDFLP